MLKRIFNTLCLLFCLTTSAFAETGDLFAVTSNGTGSNISIRLCLNMRGQTPLSCQNYITKPGTLRIRTTTPNQIYLYAGMKINTPGYTDGSSRFASGYTPLGPISDTQSAAVSVTPTADPITLLATPSISTEVNAIYSQINTASGGTTPYTFSVSAGSLPNGTSLSTTTGTVTGLPTTSGPFSYTVQVTDASGKTATAASSGTIINAVSLVATPSTYTEVNVAYSQTNTATGGTTPYTFSVSSGSLPNGTSLNTTTGTVAGTPTTAENFNYTIQVTDASGHTATAVSNGTINPLLATSTPSNVVANAGQTATFSTTTSDGTPPYLYQWQLSTNNGMSFSDIPAATASSYTTSILSTSSNGYQYRVLVTDAQSASVTSTAATLTVNSALSATITPSGLNINIGQSALFTVNPTGGSGAYSYQWYTCSNSTCTSATVIPGANTNTYSPSTTTIGVYHYQAVVTDSASTPQTTTTNVATLIIGNALSATLTPNSLIVNSGDAAIFIAIPMGGTLPYSYQWYVCTDVSCTSPTLISGESNSTYIPSTVTTGTYYYQATVTDSASTPQTVTTNVATLTVNNVLSAMVAPSSLTVNSGDPATFTATPIGGTPSYSYQWYSCTDATCASTTPISGEILSTYNPSTSIADTYYYQATVTDSAAIPATAVTNVATLTVSAPPVINNVSPSTGPTVTITGSGFSSVSGASGVTFGGTNAISYTVDSDTQITVTVPSRSTNGISVDVVVSSPSGSTTATSAYTYVPVIFVTNSTFTGDLGGFSGANTKCNIDAAKPSSGFSAGYTYKALLNGNNATTTGKAYYRTNGTTLIATATGGNLVGTSPLLNAIQTTAGTMFVWTGWQSTVACASWTSTAGTSGSIGRPIAATNQYWQFASGVSCNAPTSPLPALYCVAQ